MADYSETGSTVLPYKSKSTIGRFGFSHISSNWDTPPGSIDGTFKITLYGTSNATTAFAVSTWRNIAEQDFSCVNPIVSADMSFNTPKFTSVTGYYNKAIKSFAINVGEPTGDHIHTTIIPRYLYYSTVSIVILDSGSAMGDFYYLAFDGGYQG